MTPREKLTSVVRAAGRDSRDARPSHETNAWRCVISRAYPCSGSVSRHLHRIIAFLLVVIQPLIEGKPATRCAWMVCAGDAWPWLRGRPRPRALACIPAWLVGEPQLWIGSPCWYM